MADYYPLIARAVAGLDKKSGDARRTVYERARTALVAQLRGVTPALNESDVTRERLALEEAIRKVEAESARQPASRATAKVKAPDFPVWDEPVRDPEPPARRPSTMPRSDARGPQPIFARKLGEPRHEGRRHEEPRYEEPDKNPAIPPDPEPQEPPRRSRMMPRSDGRQDARADA